MSTPTEFDKELEKVWEEVGLENWSNKDEASDMIKQAVDNCVISRPINVFTRQNAYKRDPDQKWYDNGWNDVQDIQRRSLWGDK